MEETYVALSAEMMPHTEIISGTPGWVTARLKELRAELVAAGAGDIAVQIQVAMGDATAIVTWHLPVDADEDRDDEELETTDLAVIDEIKRRAAATTSHRDFVAGEQQRLGSHLPVGATVEVFAVKPVPDHVPSPAAADAAARIAAWGNSGAAVLAHESDGGRNGRLVVTATAAGIEGVDVCYVLVDPESRAIFASGDVADATAYLTGLQGTEAWARVELHLIVSEPGGTVSYEQFRVGIEALTGVAWDDIDVGVVADPDEALFDARPAELRRSQGAPETVPVPLTEQVWPEATAAVETGEAARAATLVECAPEYPAEIDLQVACEGLPSIEHRAAPAQRTVDHWTVFDRILTENFGATLRFEDETGARRFFQVWGAVLGPDATRDISVVPVYRDVA